MNDGYLRFADIVSSSLGELGRQSVRKRDLEAQFKVQQEIEQRKQRLAQEIQQQAYNKVKDFLGTDSKLPEWSPGLDVGALLGLYDINQRQLAAERESQREEALAGEISSLGKLWKNETQGPTTFDSIMAQAPDLQTERGWNILLKMADQYPTQYELDEARALAKLGNTLAEGMGIDTNLLSGIHTPQAARTAVNLLSNFARMEKPKEISISERDKLRIMNTIDELTRQYNAIKRIVENKYLKHGDVVPSRVNDKVEIGGQEWTLPQLTGEMRRLAQQITKYKSMLSPQNSMNRTIDNTDIINSIINETIIPSAR